MSAENTQGQHVVVRVADRLFGIDIASVQEMLELPDQTPIPNLAANCRGVINLRGRVVPVTDLRITLGIDRLAHEHHLPPLIFDAIEQDKPVPTLDEPVHP